MKVIHIHVWAHRLGTTPTTVPEALEALRKLLKEDPVAKKEFFQAAREGWRFDRFSREDRPALVLWAALKEALEKTRERLKVKDRESTLQVRLDPHRPLQPGVPSFPWRSPEGRVYPVFPWDLAKRVRPGITFSHPQYGEGKVLEVKGQVVVARFKAGTKKLALKAVKGMVEEPYAAGPDRRVAEAKGWLKRFLASGEEVRGMSRLEREEELAGNPHFSEGLIAQRVVDRLAEAGYPVDPHRLEELASLVDRLPAKEATFKDLLAEASLHADEREREILRQIGQASSLSEVHHLASKLALPLPLARAFARTLKEVGALRGLKYELHRVGYAPVQAVAYRDSGGEVVYTAPVYGR
jgi:hypothetical protein